MNSAQRRTSPGAPQAHVTLVDVAKHAGVSVGTVSNFLNRPEALTETTAERVRDAVQALGYLPPAERERTRQPGETGISDVAAEAGVSVGTVSNFLNRPEMVAPTTARKVKRAIELLGYVPNLSARDLRVGKSRSIGLLVLDIGNPFYTDFVKGAEAIAGESGYTVMIGNTEENPAKERGYLDLFQEQRVAGVIVSPAGDIRDRLQEMRAKGTSTVVVDLPSPTAVFCSVAIDDEAGGRLAAQHLVDIGRKSITFVAGPERIHQVDARLAGARRVLDQTKGTSIAVVQADAFSFDAGRAAGEHILRQPVRPDAVFAANDLLALGVLQAFFSANVRVPQDIALMGYDDIAYAAGAAVPLTSIRQPARLMGAMAAELLLEETQGAESHEHRCVVFQPELVARASTAAPDPVGISRGAVQPAT